MSSVRKSLQGLDYFAVEGARSFDDLSVIVRQISRLGPGKEWKTFIAQALKTDKLYLKGDFKVFNKEICGAYLRQDNPGCYHSSSTILSCPLISASTGVKIHRIDFSDPQGGKGAADRLAATCKSHVRLFINEENDVTTAHQLKDALLSHGGIDGVRVVAMETIEDLVEDSRKILTISKLNNFAFYDDSITAWRAYDVGKGKEIVLEKTSAGNCK